MVKPVCHAHVQFNCQDSKPRPSFQWRPKPYVRGSWPLYDRLIIHIIDRLRIIYTLISCTGIVDFVSLTLCDSKASINSAVLHSNNTLLLLSGPGLNAADSAICVQYTASIM